jgi:hypothetical protein
MGPPASLFSTAPTVRFAPRPVRFGSSGGLCGSGCPQGLGTGSSEPLVEHEVGDQPTVAAGQNGVGRTATVSGETGVAWCAERLAGLGLEKENGLRRLVSHHPPLSQLLDGLCRWPEIGRTVSDLAQCKWDANHCRARAFSKFFRISRRNRRLSSARSQAEGRWQCGVLA